MVVKEKKLRIKNFLEGRIEETHQFTILESDFDHLLIAEKREVNENSQEVYIVVQTRQIPKDEFSLLCNTNRSQRKRTSLLLYKDGILSYARLAERGNLKRKKSLKGYSLEDINKMIHLRDIEKQALEFFKGQPLLYYQPETERLPESVRGFTAQNILLNYSHLTRDNPGYGFAQDRYSLDYRTLEEVKEPQEKLLLRLLRKV